MTAQIGRSIPRLEARAKVTGRAEYAHNLRLPGMLYGKVFRSTVAHGRIRGVDTSAAASLEGVARVVTGEDIRAIIPSPYYMVRPFATNRSWRWKTCDLSASR